jgi:hypothetical protein
MSRIVHLDPEYSPDQPRILEGPFLLAAAAQSFRFHNALRLRADRRGFHSNIRFIETRSAMILRAGALNFESCKTSPNKEH